MYNFWARFKYKRNRRRAEQLHFDLESYFSRPTFFHSLFASFTLVFLRLYLPFCTDFRRKRKTSFIKNQFEIYGGALNGFFRKTIPSKQDTHCKCDCCHFFRICRSNLIPCNFSLFFFFFFVCRLTPHPFIPSLVLKG